MLDFPGKYFEPEVKSGFFISEKMKRFRAASLEVFKLLDYIAEEYGFTLYADFGTLLGAVRHGGFIPWDDDIDVSMLRNEYDQFIRILPDILPEGYCVYSHLGKNVPFHSKAFISNSVRIETSSEFIKTYHGCPFLTGLDLFPIDAIPDDSATWDTQRMLYHIVYDTAHQFQKYKETGELEGYLSKIEEFLNVTLDRGGNLESQLWVLSDKVASLSNFDEGHRVAYLADILTAGDIRIREKSWYDTFLELDFEITKIKVPLGYHAILRTIYGDNCMNFVRGASRHGYPVYLKMDPEGKYLTNPYVPESDYGCRNENMDGRYEFKKILFLIRDASKWHFFADFYMEAKKRGDSVDVIAVPYQYKNEFGHPEGNVFIEEDYFPADICLRTARDYDITKERPDIIFLQDPYDSYSLATQTDNHFYASHIRPYVKKIIFVFPFLPKVTGAFDEMSKEMLRAYLNTPGFFLADTIYVFDKQVKELFLSIFAELYEPQILKAFKKKIQISDKTPSYKTKSACHKKKKNLLFVENISFFLGKEDLFHKKYASIIDVFESSSDKMHVFWIREENAGKILSYLPEVIRKDYEDFSKKLENADWCTSLGKPSKIYIDEILLDIDAAYGAPSVFLTECVAKGIPVMVWNAEV